MRYWKFHQADRCFSNESPKFTAESSFSKTIVLQYLITKTALNDATVANGNIGRHIDSQDITSLFNLAVTFYFESQKLS